jgi:hypothetical protein
VLDEHGPAPAGDGGCGVLTATTHGLIVPTMVASRTRQTTAPQGREGDRHAADFAASQSPFSAGLVGVEAVVADEVLSFVGRRKGVRNEWHLRKRNHLSLRDLDHGMILVPFVVQLESGDTIRINLDSGV